MAALVTIVSGRFSATYKVPAGSGLDLGITNDPGYSLSWTWEMDNVKDSDAYGAQVIEQMFLGPSDVSLDFVSKEVKASPYNSINPFAPLLTTGATTFQHGVIAR